MKKESVITGLLLTLLPLYGQQKAERGTVLLDEVTVTAKRQLSHIGVQQTVLDSVALRQNITQSLGDVLSQSSTLFIKSYGRATLATASFRGTAPSHTQVTWNGIRINSPMLGQVDFSLIPSYFIDKASLYHGASSTGVTGGGLGGAVSLGTAATTKEGIALRYIQGISSYHTFDEFLHLTYGSPRWQSSTRFLYSSSDNNFRFVNYDKKIVETDEEGNKTGAYYPTERNKNGAFTDMHLMQELYYRPGRGIRMGFYAWYLDSERGLPMLSTSYSEADEKKNQQHERTLRTGADWERIRGDLKLTARIGYTYTDLNYRYLADPGSGSLNEMVQSQSYVNTGSAQVSGEYFLYNKWMLKADIAAYQHYVKSEERATKEGYRKARPEVSAFVSVRYTPTERLGIAANLREEYYGGDFTPAIPALFADYLLSKRGNLLLKASVASNFRYPTLNDLYFVPGGNDTLRTEKGYTYDGGISFTLQSRQTRFTGEITAFDSYIRDWIIWLPTFKGFWSPSNVKKVHSYGAELKGKTESRLSTHWKLNIDGNFSMTRSINHGDPQGWADNSIGKQLVYIPKYSSGVIGVLSWKEWAFTWRWNYYSTRYTTSSNEVATRRDAIEPYIMNDITLEKRVNTSIGSIDIKGVVNNLFDEAYQSVLSRPMAGRNFGIFIAISPEIKQKHNKKGDHTDPRY
ncbi:MAG: TonB-dependent receptor plug domain-containing protein [Bacteroides sp.]|nr:TonB-dependent receptor plug domain-containing protein [Bacteroides sp.]